VTTNVGFRDSVVGVVTEDFSDREGDERGEVEEGDRLETVAVSDWCREGEENRGRDVDAWRRTKTKGSQIEGIKVKKE
jgi:hypothetical protein